VNFPHQRRSARDRDQKHPQETARVVRYSSAISSFRSPGAPRTTREVTLLREGVPPPAKPTRQAFQRGVVPRVFRAQKPTPPKSLRDCGRGKSRHSRQCDPRRRNCRIRTRTYGGVTGKAGDSLICPYGPESDKRKLAECRTAKSGLKPRPWLPARATFCEPSLAKGVVS
jgi:hypothetical protein